MTFEMIASPPSSHQSMEQGQGDEGEADVSYTRFEQYHKNWTVAQLEDPVEPSQLEDRGVYR